jgi:hypothetical protein
MEDYLDDYMQGDSFTTGRSSNQESVKCIIRIRPSTDNSTNKLDSIQVIDQTSLAASNSDGSKTFQCAFDSVLDQNATQEEVIKTRKHNIYYNNYYFFKK